jgi:exopolyphosphatase/guanosine-5'-triphosphate,3'-diphosphate pyrophosphatase
MVLYSGLLDQFKDRYGFLAKRVLIVDMGAGTTHILYQDSGRVVFTDTQNEGTLRLGKRYDLPERSFAVALEQFSTRFYESLGRLHALSAIERFVAVNDDIYGLLHAFCPEREVREIFRFSAGEWETLERELAALDAAEMRSRLSLTDNLLRTTRIALAVLGRIFRLCGAEEILLPRISFSSSVVNLLSLSDGDIFSELSLELREHAVSSALALAERYRYDPQGTAMIGKLALRLFDELRTGFQFSEKERLYLEVAAILHNIGYFVSAKSHHKYSALLIASSELIGLTSREMQVVAQIARYHRRATPRASHPDYMQLTRPERMVVCRMAALLRLADALSSSSLVRIDDLSLVIASGRCSIGIRTKHRKYENLDIIRLNVRKKGDLFESFYGMALEVDRME